jgi:hypothetical protein
MVTFSEMRTLGFSDEGLPGIVGRYDAPPVQGPLLEPTQRAVDELEGFLAEHPDLKVGVNVWGDFPGMLMADRVTLVDVDIPAGTEVPLALADYVITKGLV